MIVVGAVAGWLFDQRANRTPAGSDEAAGRATRVGVNRRRERDRCRDLGDRRFLRRICNRWRWFGPGFETAGRIIGGLAFAVIAVVLYQWILRMLAARST